MKDIFITYGDTVKTLRIGYLSTLYHTSHLLKCTGWLNENGIKASWSLYGTGPAMVEAFAAGEIDLGYIGLPPAMIGIDRGVPLRCIGGGHIEGTIMIAGSEYAAAKNSSSTAQVLRQFCGKAIGSPARGSIHDVIIRYLLKRYQIDGVEVKNFSWADLIPAAIEEGEVQGAVGTPQLAVVAQTFYHQKIILPPDCLWPFNPSYGIVIRENLHGDTELLKVFLQTHEQACAFLREKPQEAAGLLAENNKAIDKNFILNTLSISPKYCASLPAEYLASTLAFVLVLKEMGYLMRSLLQEDIFDLSFIQSIHPDPHHYSEVIKDKKY
jgi:NitT/TauT family transport system substrate-binding protein